ncbi:uncharacterized protein G2W53_016290 [Senna tora]|uniref:Uncharacterized protein n=1 Tax=Senna tora TaxID=362788 RepID=A0A834WMV9_9FABA|nr:uncharacterized protein G2W53_016290 [Senna tora]
MNDDCLRKKPKGQDIPDMIKCTETQFLHTFCNFFIDPEEFRRRLSCHLSTTPMEAALSRSVAYNIGVKGYGPSLTVLNAE